MGSPTSNTDQLIDRLVAECSPVRRLFDPRRRAAWWVALALVCVGLGVSYFGIRSDLPGAMSFLPFLLRIGLLVATMWLSVVAALQLSVPAPTSAPGRAGGRWCAGALVAVTAAELWWRGRRRRRAVYGWRCVAS